MVEFVRRCLPGLGGSDPGRHRGGRQGRAARHRRRDARGRVPGHRADRRDGHHHRHGHRARSRTGGSRSRGGSSTRSGSCSSWARSRRRRDMKQSQFDSLRRRGAMSTTHETPVDQSSLRALQDRIEITDVAVQVLVGHRLVRPRGRSQRPRGRRVRSVRQPRPGRAVPTPSSRGSRRRHVRRSSGSTTCSASTTSTSTAIRRAPCPTSRRYQEFDGRARRRQDAGGALPRRAAAHVGRLEDQQARGGVPVGRVASRRRRVAVAPGRPRAEALGPGLSRDGPARRAGRLPQEEADPHRVVRRHAVTSPPLGLSTAPTK